MTALHPVRARRARGGLPNIDVEGAALERKHPHVAAGDLEEHGSELATPDLDEAAA